MERRREDGRDLPSIQLGDQGHFRIGIGARLRVERVKQRDAGPDHQFRFGKIGRQLAEMLDTKGPGQRLIDVGEADLLPSLAACGLERRLGQRIGAAYATSIRGERCTFVT